MVLVWGFSKWNRRAETFRNHSCVFVSTEQRGEDKKKCSCRLYLLLVTGAKTLSDKFMRFTCCNVDCPATCLNNILQKNSAAKKLIKLHKTTTGKCCLVSFEHLLLNSECFYLLFTLFVQNDLNNNDVFHY